MANDKLGSGYPSTWTKEEYERYLQYLNSEDEKEGAIGDRGTVTAGPGAPDKKAISSEALEPMPTATPKAVATPKAIAKPTPKKSAPVKGISKSERQEFKKQDKPLAPEAVGEKTASPEQEGSAVDVPNITPSANKIAPYEPGIFAFPEYGSKNTVERKGSAEGASYLDRLREDQQKARWGKLITMAEQYPQYRNIAAQAIMESGMPVDKWPLWMRKEAPEEMRTTPEQDAEYKNKMDKFKADKEALTRTKELKSSFAEQVANLSKGTELPEGQQGPTRPSPVGTPEYELGKGLVQDYGDIENRLTKETAEAPKAPVGELYRYGRKADPYDTPEGARAQGAKDLAKAMEEYKTQVSDAGKAKMWDTIIGAIGKIVAGGAGLIGSAKTGRAFDVAGSYNYVSTVDEKLRSDQAKNLLDFAKENLKQKESTAQKSYDDYVKNIANLLGMSKTEEALALKVGEMKPETRTVGTTEEGTKYQVLQPEGKGSSVSVNIDNRQADLGANKIAAEAAKDRRSTFNNIVKQRPPLVGLADSEVERAMFSEAADLGLNQPASYSRAVLAGKKMGANLEEARYKTLQGVNGFLFTPLYAADSDATNAEKNHTYYADAIRRKLGDSGLAVEMVWNKKSEAPIKMTGAFRTQPPKLPNGAEASVEVLSSQLKEASKAGPEAVKAKMAELNQVLQSIDSGLSKEEIATMLLILAGDHLGDVDAAAK